MKNGEKKIFKLIIIFLIVLAFFLPLSFAVEKHPIIERREEFMKNMYRELCRETPFSIYCLYTTASTVSPLIYDPYLTEYDFAIPSPALSILAGDVFTSPYCTYNVNSKADWTCTDDRWEVTGGYSGPPDTTSHAKVIAGALQLDANGPVTTAKYLINIKNKDMKTRVVISGVGSGGIMFGSEVILEGESSEWLVELIKDVTDDDKFVVLINGEPIKEIIISEDTAFIKYYANPKARMRVEYLKSRAYFSCSVNNDEVVIRDRFGEGSVFSKDDLAFDVTKFCPSDYPAVVRSYLERGVKSDIKGTITFKLARGEYLTVPQFQAYEIQYITKYIDGMKERCDPLTEYYDTNLEKCMEQGFIFEPACFIDSDCWIPSSCVGVTAQCIDGSCVYDGDCVLPPTPTDGEQNIWDLIANAWVNFWSWVRGLFS